MFRRAWISLKRNKGRTVIMAILLFVIANLVLSSIAVKSATEEAILQARLSLDPVVTLTTNREDIIAYIQAYRDEYGERPSQDDINAMLVPITSDVAFGILGVTDAIEDYNFSYQSSATAVGFLPLDKEGVIDPDNESKITVIGTYNPLMLDQFDETVGTYRLTDDSLSFDGADTGKIIVSYNLATANDIVVGDEIALVGLAGTTSTYVVAGIFYTDDLLDSSGGSVTDNNVYIPLNDALALQGQDPSGTFTITSATYYLTDPLDIEPFISAATLAFSEIADGDLIFSDTNYDAIVAPLENVGSFSDLVLVISIAAAVVILTLLVVNSLKERRYEIGVLLSLGENKVRISLQYLFELVFIALAIFFLSIPSSAAVSGYLGDTLLANEITDLTETSTTTSVPKGGGGNLSTTVSDPVAVDYDQLDMDVRVTVSDFAITLAIGLGIILMSSVVPSLYITRYQPKKILSSRV